MIRHARIDGARPAPRHAGLRCLVVLLPALACAPFSRGAPTPAESGEAGQTSAAVQQVETLHAALLQSMKQGASVSFAERRARLADVVAATFDVQAIARISLGRHWRSLDDAGRRRLVAAMQRLIASTYADRFDGYGGQRFEVLETSEPQPGRHVVRTRIQRPGGEPVSLDYQLRRSEGVPRIFNVIANGVSDLSMRRAEYTAVFERSGLDGLLHAMQATIGDRDEANEPSQ